jgi:hypothetical protein
MQLYHVFMHLYLCNFTTFEMTDAFASVDAASSNRFVGEVIEFHGAMPHVTYCRKESVIFMSFVPNLYVIYQ